MANRIVSIPTRRCCESRGFPQLDTEAQIRMQEEPPAVHQHRQEHREGPPVSCRGSLQAASGGEARSSRLHEPGRHVHGPGPLRNLLGTEC